MKVFIEINLPDAQAHTGTRDTTQTEIVGAVKEALTSGLRLPSANGTMFIAPEAIDIIVKED